MQNLPSRFLRALACLSLICFQLPTAQAASSMLINFWGGSTATGNQITEAEARALGAESFINVLTGSTNSAGATSAINASGVTGSVTYADYYQLNQKTQLGQPYATFIGPNQIGSTGRSAVINLNLASWLAANGLQNYAVKIFYAGRSANSEALFLDSDPDVHFNGSLTDSVTVTGHGTSTATMWKGEGRLFSFQASNPNLEITMDYLGGTSDLYQGGIAAILILPEPGMPALVGLSVLALLNRRRRAVRR